MGHEIEDTSTAPSSEYMGTTYYFCCEDCKASFDENPANYAGNTGGHHSHHHH
ncbi:MAG TPA: YHS domain-containing protein [Balneolaceae bacterium]|nr:YHS domain-containing protein [Balneolaceae bacterium]